MVLKLASVVIANRCGQGYQVNLRRSGQPATQYPVPDGEDLWPISCDTDALIIGAIIYNIGYTRNTNPGDVVIIRHDPTTLMRLQTIVFGLDGSMMIDTTDNGLPYPLGDQPGRYEKAKRRWSDLTTDELAEGFRTRIMKGTSLFNLTGNGIWCYMNPDGVYEPNDLVDTPSQTLSGLNADPQQTVANGIAPAVTSLPVVPDVKLPNMPQLLQCLNRSQSVLAMFAAIDKYAADKKRGYSNRITEFDQAISAFSDQADSIFNSLTGALAGIFFVEETTASSFSEEMWAADVHLEFLNAIFDGFNFSAKSLSALDGFLRQVTKATESIKISFSGAGKTLNHTIASGLIEAILADDGTVVGYNVAYRLTYVRVDLTSWSLAVGKSSASRMKFNMTFTDVKYGMDMDLFNSNYLDYNKTLMTLVKKNLDDYAVQITSPQVPAPVPDGVPSPRKHPLPAGDT